VSWALITNDDGIAAPGLHALAASAVAAGLRVVVAAPAEEASGAGSAVTTMRRDGHVPVTRHELPGLAGVPAYGVAAAPAFIPYAAVRGWFPEPPSLVLSGINAGANLGRAIMHSGTVGAALTGGRFGIRALAVSLDSDAAPPGVAPLWETAGGLLPTVLDVLGETPAGTVLTLNVPNLPPERLAPLRVASLAVKGMVQTRVDSVDGSGLRVRLAERYGQVEPGSDVALLAAGHPTLTAVRSVAEDPGLPLADLVAARLDGKPTR
jgi:5'/3'-nucleotidase